MPGRYGFLPLLLILRFCLPCAAALAPGDDAFLDLVEKHSFKYFLENTNPENGIVNDYASNSKEPDRKYSPSSIAAVGFGLACVPAGVERGWLPRADAERLVKNTLSFFRDKMESEHGFFYHFADMETGRRYLSREVSSIDTALFLAGALTAAQYLADPEIKALAEGLYERADWKWMTNGKALLCAGWSPENGFDRYYWHQYDESMVMYILAMGSPTHPMGPEGWKAIRRIIGRYKGHEFIYSPPLFTHQFSHAFIDFRGKSDGFADYFRNSVEATLANRRFCMDNAKYFKTYGPDSWGITACMGPDGYVGYGAAPGTAIHDGTIAPAAAAGSIVFTPELSLAAMKNFYKKHKDRIWGRYGFADAFNLDRDFVASDVYGINQGPTVMMLENYRSGLIWKLFMSLPQVQRGMKEAGFGAGPYIALNKKVLPFTETAVYFPDRKPSVTVKRAADTVKPEDLGPDSPLWKRAKAIILDRKLITRGFSRQKDYRVKFDLLANSAYLFARISARDSQVVAAPPGTGTENYDSAELFMDPLNDRFRWDGTDDLQFVFSPGEDGKLRVKEERHGDRASGACRVVSFSRTPGGWSAVLAFDRAALKIGDGPIGFNPAARNVDVSPESDARLEWYFHTPAIYLGVMNIEKAK